MKYVEDTAHKHAVNRACNPNYTHTYSLLETSPEQHAPCKWLGHKCNMAVEVWGGTRKLSYVERRLSSTQKVCVGVGWKVRTLALGICVIPCRELGHSADCRKFPGMADSTPGYIWSFRPTQDVRSFYFRASHKSMEWRKGHRGTNLILYWTGI